jgi:hypothetical protein
VDTYFSSLLLDIYTQILRTLAFVSNLKGFTKLDLEFKDYLQVTAEDGYIINV